MKVFTLAGAAALLATATASPLDVSIRALPNAPDGYTPTEVSCPATRPSIRGAGSLSPNETSWLDIRRANTIQPMKDLLGRLNLTSFDAAAYIDRVAKNVSNLPNIAIAVSGGGYRALTNGAGALKAFDNRTDGATGRGQLGGLLQSATYVSGLSGGSWLVGSVYINNFTTIQQLQAGGDTGDLWQFSTNILEGPKAKHLQLLSTADYWKHLADAVDGKRQAGFNISLTDYWGRALSYQFINDPADRGGPDYTWSSIALTDSFQRGEIPMPIVVADGRNPGEVLVGSNSTVYEFNPWEFGSFDPNIFGFAPLEFLGSRFDNGRLPRDASCVRGFDSAGFVMGTSSTLFNQFILHLNKTDLPDVVRDAFAHILTSLGRDGDDIAVYAPNPFYGYRNSTAAYSQSRELDVVDGGEDGQNIPLHPLIQPTRHVDVIFAVDSSANTHYSWPNGSSLVATYERSLNTTGIGNGTVFPPVPDVNTFINLGLNTRPTFFGCDAANLSAPAPLVVYLPNAPYSAASNTSTFQLAYSDAERDEIITNGYNVVTRGNGTVDHAWPSCVGCAILSRSMHRTNTALPEVCNSCFKEYCWNGTLDSSTPKPYEPTAVLGKGQDKSAASRVGVNSLLALVVSVGVFTLI
ncbi:lysophospholipase family protein [Aspergillus clavatus NRRL 1]|uniref:Lysophospholipase n=1 Tax=Aspergillus clavatus (strain ATCC 1007 / CBS 513.65 / DSM 816 / NCTC 3887 / NRRL 1 / QM 1276 / 107) TaxID=344612 RepID=A1CLH0_ASPCL|nr:lysophospholipase Plb3 [Aspergillus clavatus NRRL 1]EAW09994.1 lysophospholipase Plb3 [Aspergillus clavatus NRRL 1]